MSEESARDRSPRSPVTSLERALTYVGKFHTECRRNAVAQETAAKAMGFNTVHGGTLTLLAGLREYGLIDRPGGKVVLTALAVKILHPISEDQKKQAINEAALAPKVFRELLSEFGDCSANVIESHLVQSGFTPDRAKLVAKVFLANKVFAQLGVASNVIVSEDEDHEQQLQTMHSELQEVDFSVVPRQERAKTPPLPHALTKPSNVLAQYTIPLGANQATLVFTGEKLAAEDFEALADFVEFSKKQFERAEKSAFLFSTAKTITEGAVVDDPEG